MVGLLKWIIQMVIILEIIGLSVIICAENVSEVVPTTLEPFDSEKNSGNSTVDQIISSKVKDDDDWECPDIESVECSCDFPHTLRCTSDQTSLQIINKHLKHLKKSKSISLLDVTINGISILPERFLENITLHGLVVSTAKLRKINENALIGLSASLQALGLPNNLLDFVPTAALNHLHSLDRLDLSHNKLKTLEAHSFKGITSLTYLDLCNNLLSQLSPQAFAPLKSLRSLKMHGNRLSISALSALRGLKNLEELDLSNNLLIGPLGPNLLPSMPKLKFLTISENELINVEQGALIGFKNLTVLSLSHNQIDVLEDHSFKHLSTLTHLDLASNRIVAVSSASLAHLDKLITLDLTHNFLRSLTSDLILPLKNLQDLRLDDNDITMISSDLPTSKLRLKRLSLGDNPFNCDCTLLDFANWLNNSSLDDEDKSSAVCATPPALENGILTKINPGSLLCGEPTAPIMNKLPLAGAQLTLKELHYDKNTGINLLWNVHPCAERYTCDTLIVYEPVDDSEIEIENSPLNCDSTLMKDPCSLSVTVPTSFNLQPGHRYRYCIVLLVPSEFDELSLGLGCSDVIKLEEIHSQNVEQDNKQLFNTSKSLTIDEERILGVHVNVSEQGFLSVDVSLALNDDFSNNNCELSVVIFAGSSPLHKKKLNCSISVVTIADLLPGRYKVCASLDNIFDHDAFDSGIDKGRSRCVEIQAFRQNLEFIIIIVAIAVTSCTVFIIIFFAVKSLIKKSKPPRIQCFRPTQEFEITHKAHYIKLLATTKV